MAGHFTKKCFYFMIFNCYKLKLSVSKNWQLFSNFNTHQFWSQKQLKTNWAHFFEHKERPQCANIWQSLKEIGCWTEKLITFCHFSPVSAWPKKLPNFVVKHVDLKLSWDFGHDMLCMGRRIDINNEGGLDTSPSSLYWQIEPGVFLAYVYYKSADSIIIWQL